MLSKAAISKRDHSVLFVFAVESPQRSRDIPLVLLFTLRQGAICMRNTVICPLYYYIPIKISDSETIRIVPWNCVYVPRAEVVDAFKESKSDLET